MIGEIQRVLPALKQTVAGFGLTNPTEADAYNAMIKRLEIGLGVDWSRFHSVHSNVKVAVPKKPKAVNLANGGMVRGPGGPKDDAIPANLSNGEAVIDAATVKKNPGIIAALFQKKKIAIPGYAENNAGMFPDISAGIKSKSRQDFSREISVIPELASAIDLLVDRILGSGEKLSQAQIFDRLKAEIEPLIKLIKTTRGFSTKGAGTGGSSASGTNLAHGSPKLILSQEQANSIGQQLIAQGFTGRTSQSLANAQGPTNAFSNLVFPMPRAGNAGDMSGDELSEWIRADRERFVSFIYEHYGKGAGLASNDPALMTFADNVANGLAEAGAQAVGDERFYEVIENGIRQTVEGAARQALIDAQNDIRTADVPGSEGKVRREAIQSGARIVASGPRTMLENGTSFSAGNVSVGASSRPAYVGARKSIPKELFDAQADEFLVKVLKQRVRKILQDGLGINSPSAEYNDISNSVTEGVRQAEPEAKKAGERIGEAVANTASATGTQRSGPRRASDNPEVMALLAGRSQAQLNSEVRNTTREQRRATRVADVSMVAAPLMSKTAYGPEENPENRSKRITAATEKQMQQMGKLTSSMSTAAMSMSAVTGILSMFGGEMSAVTSVISLVTGGMFALMQVMSMLSASTGAAAVMQKVNAAGGLGSLFMQFKGVSTGLKGFGKGISGIFGVLKGAFPIAARLVPVLGLVLAGFTAFTFITDLIEKQRQKVEGLGNAAAFSSDQIKNLGEKLNVAVKTIDYTAGVSVASGGQSTAEQERTANFLLDPEFKVEYADAIAGIEFATKEQAERALSSLATQLVNSGFDEETANAIVAAVVKSAGRTDLSLKFNSIKIDSAATAAAVADQAAAASAAFNASYEGPSGLFGPSEQQTKDAQLAAGVIKGSFDSLNLAFRDGLISVTTYESEIADLFNTISASDTPAWLTELIADDMGIGDFVRSLGDAEAKAFAVKAAVAGIEIAPADKKILQAAKGTPIGSNERKEATKVINRYAFAIGQAADNLDRLNKVEKETERVEAITDVFSEQKEKIEQNDAAYKALRESGLNAADSIGAVGDAAFMEAWILANTHKERQDLINQYKELMEVLGESPFEKAKNRTSSGGSNPIADAIKALKEERNEILNTSKAYSALRKRGMDAATSLRFAQNPQLLAAMNAGLRVGSKQWDEIIKRIKAAERAARRFQMATTSGQKEYFDEVYGKVEDLFSAQENLMRATFAAATAADSELISRLEEQIEGLNSQIEEYQFALDEIAEQEEAINKEYDKKVKALEEVKRVNEDIIRQQKAQLSISDALSQGDIAGAARAIQESRAENARAALDGQGNLLDAARQAQLDAVRASNGLTREQIESRIRTIKKEILEIERGELREARERVRQAEIKLERDIRSLEIHGKTRVEWELIKARTDKAEAAAALYTKEVKRALGVVNKMVRAWEKLKGLAGVTVNEDPFAETPVAMMAKGGMVKPSYYARGGAVRPSYYSNGGFAKGTDTVPAMLTPGEFVVNRKSTKKFGSLLSSINSDTIGKNLSRSMSSYAPTDFNEKVYNMPARAFAKGQDSGSVYTRNESSNVMPTQIDNSVYNYSLNVNVEGSDADANEIARVVMSKIRKLGSQQLRGAIA
jgi:hypothetical protein